MECFLDDPCLNKVKENDKSPFLIHSPAQLLMTLTERFLWEEEYDTEVDICEATPDRTDLTVYQNLECHRRFVFACSGSSK